MSEVIPLKIFATHFQADLGLIRIFHIGMACQSVKKDVNQIWREQYNSTQHTAEMSSL